LTGGIHNYQEAFPDGGFFHGKNFVYDPRKAVPCKNVDEVIGKCRVCDAPYDDYAPQVRCRKCRMLQLVCDTCREQDQEFLENSVICTMCAAKK
jgi:predicted sulfurtransferase